MPCIQLGSLVGHSRVPQVHFVRKHFIRKQTMYKSLYTYLTICFAFEKPRWLLHNTADRAETVFSHLKHCPRPGRRGGSTALLVKEGINVSNVYSDEKNVI